MTTVWISFWYHFEINVISLANNLVILVIMIKRNISHVAYVLRTALYMLWKLVSRVSVFRNNENYQFLISENEYHTLFSVCLSSHSDIIWFHCFFANLGKNHIISWFYQYCVKDNWNHVFNISHNRKQVRRYLFWSLDQQMDFRCSVTNSSRRPTPY